jgi:hypothetical protein
MAPRKKHYTFEECAKDRPDYIEHGSEKHANSIGLVEGNDSPAHGTARRRNAYADYPSHSSGADAQVSGHADH